LKQKLHRPRHLLWRAVVAAASDVMMATGLYPLVPHAGMVVSRRRKDRALPGQVRAALREWGVAVALSAARPCGFFGLPGGDVTGPRPVILVHGYAMNRANFLPLARRLGKAGLGPVLGFEYWSLGKTASAAKRLGEYVDEVRAATGAAEVDIIGHSMGGVVGRYYVQLGGGDGIVRNLITIGSPHAGTDVSAVGIGRPTKELFFGSNLLERLRTAPLPRQTRMTVIRSRSDALVPGARQARIVGVDEIVYEDLGHLSMLASRRVARVIIDRLR
jgi:triacylglycerol esterase/lipase EstA (alpha/beta hydrolase family)